ncbi:MAG TPA: CcmD family protein [Armatimonadota bacterium]|nr:CcmD family protein [Armatimonadota bacterium]HPO72737.1 CcmD family protein [Armatimonadota bacterium]
MSPLHEVMVVVLVIWAGLFAYLWRLDTRIREGARQQREAPGDQPDDAPEAVLEPGPGRLGEE